MQKKNWFQTFAWNVFNKNRTMKLSFLLFALVLLNLQANTYAQAKKLSLDIENESIEKVLEKIESKSKFNFFYNTGEVDVRRKVTLKVENTSIFEILELLFNGKNVSHKVLKKQIVLKKKLPKQAVAPEKTVIPNKTVVQTSVSGTITNSDGTPLPGANIVEKGTTNGVQTDFDGNFSINITDENATLIISYIGFATQEVPVNGQSQITVALKEDAAGLDEVVVVGYGSQRKKDLTGAVGDIGSEAIGYKPVTQVSQALAGEISGVTIQAETGSPGRNGAQINIRGLGTFSDAGNSPLILVDGVPSSLDNLDPNNIESISVLKDASSASIYGSRAANGVLLVTTKKGKEGKMVVTYNGYTGFQRPTQFPDFVESAEYAELQNEFVINSGSEAVWTDEQIELFRSGADPDNYPNPKRYKTLFESGSGFQMGHSFGFSGGTAKNTFNFSVGYIRQDGLIEQNSYDRYNFLLNITNKMSDKLEINVSLQGDLGTIDEPAVAASGVGLLEEGSQRMNGILTAAIRQPPTIPGILSDGSFGGSATFHSEADLASPSFFQEKRHHFLGSTALVWRPLEGLSLTGRVGYNMNHYNSTTYNSTFELAGPIFIGPSSLTTYQEFDSELIIDLFAEYKKSINDHNLSFMVGYNQDAFMTERLTGFRDNFPTNNLYRLDAGAAGNQQNAGEAEEWALQSGFGRFQYDYQGKYLLTLSARYDGSSRFPEDTRYGFFPAVAAAWRISDEGFMSDVATIDNLKLRASWGKLGNQQIGNYPYQNVLALGNDYPFGVSETLVSGAALEDFANQQVSWETTTGIDIGLDMTMFNRKLNLVIDYFDKTTSDILYGISTSQTLGLNPSEVNAGTVSNKGWEFEVGYNDNAGDFTYGLNFVFSVVDNKIEELAGIEEDIPNGLFVEEPLLSTYGYVDDGFFVDQADVDSYPTQPFPAEPGFIRYKDISGPDGVPDGVVDAVYDRKVIGSGLPKYTFGANLSAGYKGFDLVAQFSGAAGMERSLQSLQAQFAFQNDIAPQRWQVDGRWTVENPSRNASYPKFSTGLSGGSPTQPSTFWLRDASFVRLSNLQIGYSLPQNVLETIKMQRLRVYVGGSNLLTIDKFFDGWDPEPTEPGKNFFYPFTSVYTVGINAQF